VPPRLRQLREHFGENTVEQIAERREGQLRLGVDTGRLENGEAMIAGGADALAPERRLPDTSLSLDQQHDASLVLRTIEERDEGRQLLVPADYVRHGRDRHSFMIPRPPREWKSFQLRRHRQTANAIAAKTAPELLCGAVCCLF
jgi:hypothetical protein